MPPTIEYTMTMLQTKEGYPTFWSAPTFQAARIMSQAMFEALDKQCVVHRSNSRFMEVRCCHCETFDLRWTKTSNSGMFNVKTFVDHDESCSSSLVDHNAKTKT